MRPEDPYTFIYTSGTTGPPKGCVLTHGNYRAIVNMIGESGEISDDEVIYLYLPLAHSFALLIQLAVFDLGGTLAYFGGDTKQIVPELMEVKPTYLPSVPRVFEKIYTLAHGAIEAKPPEERQRAQEAIKLGVKVRDMINRGEAVPEELQKPFDEADEELFKLVRAIFGGNVRHATSGAAPIAKEILEFFWACGVPVLEGYGMTETATAATVSTVENHRFGTVGRALPGVELRIAEDGEILIKGPNIFRGYHNRAEESFGAVEDGWLHTGDLGSLDEDGYLSITGRKKDIIITAGGKNLTPANIENDLKQCRWISQAVMHGDQRPYPVVLITLDEEEIPTYASEHDLPQDIPSLSASHEIRELIQREVDRANREIRAGRAGQEVRDPRPRPLAGHRRADADAEGQAQRRQRAIRRPVRLALHRLTGSRPHSCEHRDQMRSDPSENGGLFVGRRPGTAPVRFRELPKRGGVLRQRIDGSLAGTLLSAMLVLSLLCWGPIPLACLWLGSQVDYLSGSVTFGIFVSFVALFVFLFGALAILRRLDQAWILVRRAAGHDQRSGHPRTDLRDHRGDLRAALRVLVHHHQRTRRRRVSRLHTPGSGGFRAIPNHRR